MIIIMMMKKMQMKMKMKNIKKNITKIESMWMIILNNNSYNDNK